MKYIVKIILPVVVLLLALTWLVITNCYFLSKMVIWNVEMPTYKKIKAFNEHYTKTNGNNKIYYKTFIHYIYRKGYSKSLYEA